MYRKSIFPYEYLRRLVTLEWYFACMNMLMALKRTQGFQIKPAGSPSTRVICAVYLHLVFNLKKCQSKKNFFSTTLKTKCFFCFFLVKMTFPIHFLHFKNTQSHPLNHHSIYCRCLCDFQMSGNRVSGLLFVKYFWGRHGP
jgi:hypothetical protein